MSELEDRWFWAYPTESVDCDGITGSANEVYSKSDVDKVIAEKDKQLRHHKYKRCLAMAEWCNANYLRQYMFKPNFWQRWNNRLLKIAEQFKDKEA